MRIRFTLRSSTVAIHGFLGCFCLKSGAFDAPERPRVCPETTGDSLSDDFVIYREIFAV